MKAKIIADLGANYNTQDGNVLDNLIEEVSNIALAFSNQSSTDNLEFEIKEAVKRLYLQRGVEDVKSLSESGRSSVYEDTLLRLRRDIVANGKRLYR